MIESQPYGHLRSKQNTTPKKVKTLELFKTVTTSSTSKASVPLTISKTHLKPTITWVQKLYIIILDLCRLFSSNTPDVTICLKSYKKLVSSISFSHSKKEAWKIIANKTMQEAWKEVI